MKTEKIVRTLVLVIICILIIQILLSMLVLMLSGDPNSRIGSISSILTMASGIILGLFLSKLFELFTGRNFGEMYYKFYSFGQPKNSENNDEISD